MYGIINKTNVQNVKITMLEPLLSLIAPHPCCSCGALQSILCDNCKYNIVSDSPNACIVCTGMCGVSGICSRCHPPYSRAFLVGKRTAELRRLIDVFKFENAKAAHEPLARLLSEKIGTLPPEITIVPVPTIPSHIRQRGYDHMALVAKKLAKLQGASVNLHLLQRAAKTQQRGASKAERRAQAQSAFKTARKLRGGTYLLIDDIITTGATLHFAAKALLDAGADEVWVGAIAKQPI